jgi:hypothetical protein
MKILLFLGVLLYIVTFVHGQEERPSEDERCELWYQNGNVWPPTWQEESESMKEKMISREDEIMLITGSSERSHFNFINPPNKKLTVEDLSFYHFKVGKLASIHTIQISSEVHGPRI